MPWGYHDGVVWVVQGLVPYLLPVWDFSHCISPLLWLEEHTTFLIRMQSSGCGNWGQDSAKILQSASRRSKTGETRRKAFLFRNSVHSVYL